MTDVEPIYQQIAARILSLREQRGITQGELAEAVGMSRPSIANIEAFRQRIMIHQVQSVADVLGVPWLLLMNEKPWQQHDTKTIAEAFDAY